MKVKYEYIMKKLSDSLNVDYIKNCDEIEKNLFSHMNLENNYCNERTVAYYSTYFFNNCLIDKVKNVHVLNELFFKRAFNIGKQEMKELNSEVDNLAKEDYKNQLEPDAFIMFEMLNKKYNYFIEYKVHKNSFTYFKLANDYLKYKIYTYQTNTDTKYVYIIFDKKSNGMPSIVKDGQSEPKIQYLKKKIKKTEIDKKANVFIYDKDIENKDNIKGDKILTNKEIDSILKFDRKLSKLEELSDSVDLNSIEDYSQNVFVKNISCLGTNVSTASAIQYAYQDIKNIYDHFELNLDNIYKKVNSLDGNNITSEEKLIEWAKNYFNNIIDTSFKQDFNNFNKALIKGNKRKSLIFLILLEKFCIDNNYSYFKVNVKQEEKEDLEKIRNSIFYENLYKIPSEKKKYEALIITLIYFIINLYSLVFEENNEKTYSLEYNEKYKSYVRKKTLLEQIRSIKKLIGKTQKETIKWDEDFEELGVILLETILNSEIELE